MLYILYYILRLLLFSSYLLMWYKSYYVRGECFKVSYEFLNLM